MPPVPVFCLRLTRLIGVVENTLSGKLRIPNVANPPTDRWGGFVFGIGKVYSDFPHPNLMEKCFSSRDFVRFRELSYPNWRESVQVSAQTPRGS